MGRNAFLARVAERRSAGRTTTSITMHGRICFELLPWPSAWVNKSSSDMGAGFGVIPVSITVREG
jgi:hypothetical protein